MIAAARILGLDLGGTDLKWVVLDGDHVEHDGTVPTRQDDGAIGVLEGVAATARDVLGEHGPMAAIGLGMPGIVDRTTDRATVVPNLPGDWTTVPVQGTIDPLIGQRALVVNDARAFVLGEALVGAGQGCRHVLGVTIGTGVGGGVVIDRRLHLGLSETAGEIGHTTVIPDGGPRCGCGSRGCLETVASARAMAREAGHESIRETVEAARAGDERSRAAIERGGRYLGLAISNALLLVAPERVVIGGGGVAAAGDDLLAPVRATVKQHNLVSSVDRIDIVPAALGPHAGAIGAALWARQATSA